MTSKYAPYIDDLRHARNRQRVLIDDDFARGLNGWSGLINTGINYYPSLYPAGAVSPYSMLVDCRGGVANVEANASKRTAAYEGLYKVTALLAWNADAQWPSSTGVNSLDKLRVSFDWQRKSDKRLWVEAQYLDYSEAVSDIWPRYRVSHGSATIPTRGEIASLSAPLDAAGAPVLDAGYRLGYNQAYKYDFHLWEEEFILDYSGGSRWESFSIDGHKVDISEHSLEEDVQSVAEHFDNGGNLLFQLENRPTSANADPYLLVGYVRMTVEE